MNENKECTLSSCNDVGNSWILKKEAVCLLVILLSLVVFFKEALLGNSTLIWDGADYFYPNFFYVSDSIRHGVTPLWNPYLLNGYPLIANIEAQIFYPINLLFLPFTALTPYAVQLGIILHFFIAGASMYALARLLINYRLAALLSAFVYMYSGFMIGHIEHVTMIEVMAWLPLVFLLLEMALRRGKIVYAVYSGFFFGVSILAGHPQTSHAMGFFLVMYALYRGVSAFLKNRQLGILLFPPLALAVCFSTGVLIAAVQILPTYEVVRESTRGVPILYDIAAGSGQFSLQDAISVIVPNFFGALTTPYWGDLDIAQSILYIGVMPTILIGISILFDRKRAGIVFFAAMALFSLLLALGVNGPLFRLFYGYAPGFKFFRSPAHTVFIYIFCASLLAGFGADVLTRAVKRVPLYSYLALFPIICVVVYFLSPVPPEAIVVEGIRNIHYGLVAAFGIMAGAIILIAVCLISTRYRRFLLTGLLLVTFADLYYQFSGATPTGVKGSPSIYERAPEAIAKIKANEGIVVSNQPEIELNDSELSHGLFRVYTKPEGVQGAAPFGFNRAMIFKTFLVEGFEPLDLSRHRKLITTLSARNLDNLMKITNSRYITSIETGELTGQVYPNSLPRAYIVANAQFIENDDKVLERLGVNDPASEVVISAKGKDVTGEAMATSEWKAEVSKYTGNRIDIRTQSQKSGYLVLSDTYYPGWRAKVDGVIVPVLRANYDFRAVFLPKGAHTVVFEYPPPHYLMFGIMASVVALLIVISCFFYARRAEPDGKPRETGACTKES